ncbi:MAG: magnesium transporter [Candidatus Fluviicola riflensis]|nr:MAG: magnesium transporter [Candidatus Fluviicola riflensis]OGS77972.1 MAG: magnesium transporter [Candidatus Fluviicola riflensis]OGS85037.1 MAG: magnesium transporter [Fluviicola sp. RIFCSPHIGHO2_01_FULL_43_53]OGS89309.1 MAG: magnesium transporter [Fluviicola sp. RIFCSPHIGHO2_12_FULL_43_24]
MRFELTKEFLERIRQAIVSEDTVWILEHVSDLHFADIAEIIDELSMEQARFLYYQLSEELQADVLMELEEEVRDRFVASLSSKEIAEQLENLDSDDAADILMELPDEKIQEVISQMEDDDAADDIVDLLNYDEDTAGGLMQKEFIQARLEWPVNRALVELRRQAEDVEQVYTIYVVDDLNKLVGVLSLKRLLFASPKTQIRDLYQDKNLIFVKTNDPSEKVAKIMDKYDLVSVPVVDLQNKLVGRITIDDVIDIIKEEADKDFQLASGLSEKVESNSTIWRTSRARLPWLLIGMLGGILSAQVISKFEGNITHLPALAFFIPLITAMGGNVGVQSSAIVVQSLAKGNDPFDSILQKVGKEALLGLLNGVLCATLIFGIAYLFNNVDLAFVVSISLFTVIVFAAVFGTMIPLVLNRYKIDPALASGPFITTLNDVLGLFIYFTVGLLLIN